MPRASGDTPSTNRLYRGYTGDAPRKWGYTHAVALVDEAMKGCPAQVGIHLILVFAAVKTPRMPRASGDTPALNSGSWRKSWDAPRKWGYTVKVTIILVLQFGCPAQVGIHRLVDAGDPRIRRMPRASGDTPLYIVRII